MQQDRGGMQKDSYAHLTPSPPLPRKRGREQTEFVARSVASSPASASPPSRKGGATRASLPPERIPFHRGNGVRGGLARRERLGREIVDRDRGGDGVGGGAKLLRLGVGDQSLLPRLLDVARVRLVQALAQRLRRDREREGALEAREPLVADAVEDVDGEPLARRRRVEQDLGAGAREPVGRAALVEPERQHHKAKEPRHRPVGEIGEDRIEARLDGGEALFHAPRYERQVGALAALLVPALEHGGEEIKLGENVAEARGEHLLALERAAQRQERHVDGEREGRRVASELLIEAARSSRRRRRREDAGPRPPPRAKAVGQAVPEMTPERAVELFEAAGAVGILERGHFLEQVGMAADRALPELDEAARDDVGAFDRDADGHRAVEAAEIVE